MRWAPIHPRQLLALGLLTLALMLALLLAATPDLSTLDFSVGTSAEAPATPPTTTTEPTWVTDPLAPPLSGLRS